MGSKIDLVRFFTTKLEKHGGDHWLEHDDNYAIDPGGASGAGLRAIIERELAAPGSSGCVRLTPLARPGTPATFHESLDFEETAQVDAMAYVFTLPPEQTLVAEGVDPVHHHPADLTFQADVGVPTRFAPKAGATFIEFGAVLDKGKSAWFEIDRKTLARSSVADALRKAKAEHMVVPIGLNIIDANVGISSWILPYGKAHAYPASPLGPLWHGGPHPPENTSITVAL